MNVTVFLGAPGSGKGTQAKKLAESQGYQHLSTGDMLRSAIQQGSAVGTKAKGYIDRGELVPDKIMIELIEETFKVFPANQNILLDGFPRTVAQAEALDKNTDTAAKLAVYFELPEDALVERLTGRLICENDGEPFHKKFRPPKVEGICDTCGGKLIQRSDDTEEVVRKRLEIFKQTNEGLLSYYKDRNNLKKINADQAIDTLQIEMNSILKTWYT